MCLDQFLRKLDHRATSPEADLLRPGVGGRRTQSGGGSGALGLQRGQYVSLGQFGDQRVQRDAAFGDAQHSAERRCVWSSMPHRCSVALISGVSPGPASVASRAVKTELVIFLIRGLGGRGGARAEGHTPGARATLQHPRFAQAFGGLLPSVGLQRSLQRFWARSISRSFRSGSPVI